MPLAAGSRLGPYEVLSALGAGGMGEVYRARDSKLNRDVALKILPEAFTLDGDRIARFRREAQVLASLNHPNIAAIYGFEDSGSTHALVLELVEGPTLADRIARGPIPLDEALPIAKQIAEALEAAHEKGVVHRDLKPANIKVTPAGSVKVLDFGLAKLAEAPAVSGAGVGLSQSPTITTPAMMTGVGTILGTAAYMAPEQAKGRLADKRSDIWAFGCVLYEMLTGRRAFPGEDVTDTLAAVVRAEPDWGLVPRGLSPSLLVFMRRTLQKDPKQRVGDIQDVRLALEGAFETAASQSPTPIPAATPRKWLALLLTIAAISVFTLAALVRFRGLPPAERMLRLSVPIPRNSTVASFALSPDGRRLAVALLGQPGRQLWIRDLDSQQLQLLSGTTGAQYPFWSPDSRSIGFFAQGKLKTIAASGGPSEALCDVSAGGGGAWNRSGVILFGTDSGPAQQVSAPGGTCTSKTGPRNYNGNCGQLPRQPKPLECWHASTLLRGPQD